MQQTIPARISPLEMSDERFLSTGVGLDFSLSDRRSIILRKALPTLDAPVGETKSTNVKVRISLG